MPRVRDFGAAMVKLATATGKRIVWPLAPTTTTQTDFKITR